MNFLPDMDADVRLELGRQTATDPVTISNALQAQGVLRSAGRTQQLFTELDAEFNGLGPLQRFVDQPGITDVLVDPAGNIWVDSAAGLVLCDGPPLDEAFRRKLAAKVVSQAGKRLDDAVPFADVHCGNYRFHAVIPPISAQGTTLSIRVHQRSRRSLQQLAQNWADSQIWQNIFLGLIRSRSNFLISGATGTGKTTLLAAVLSEVAAAERILVVEDTPELQPDHPHVVALTTRTPNVEGTGHVELTELIRQALRMRPDRLIVGECRGAEIRDFLAAMNTGHSGAGGTVHANSVAAVPARLIAMGALAGFSPETTALQATSALDFVVQLQRDEHGRQPVEIASFTQQDGVLEVIPVLKQVSGHGLVEGPGWQDFAAVMDGASCS